MIRRNDDGTFAQGTNSGKRFKKGGTPWNKGLKKIHLSPETEFQEDQYVGENHPSWKGGVQTNKNDCVYLWAGKNNRVRRARKVYEDTYGEIPREYVIYHIDGDNSNDHPSNLEAISRAELVKRNASKNSKRK
ncbi:HNH endonuclease [Methanosarcina sp.]|uniref:HNH endonuclease n=1 Tax=Methanosarcina sp. TaxID=2213 RepID=UPI002AB80ED0|nr:HNH endonuclease [Methanosarcina sp.]MDY9924878.1 HNH endonuclease [Methanosarcina sp.]